MPYFFMKKILVIIACFSPLSLLACGHKKEYSTLISSVHDGDTFTTSKGDKIRLFGVDAPELTNQYNDFNPTDGLEQVYAVESLEFVKNKILNKSIYLNEITTDKYHRTVAKIIFNNKDLGLELIHYGLARVAYISTDKANPFYSNDFQYYKLLLKEQYFAYTHEYGIWKYKNKFKEIFPKA